MALTDSDADSRLTVSVNHANATASSTRPNTSAAFGEISPAGIGRECVRRITWSRSRSIQQLIVLAPPAESAPPSSTAPIRPSEGSPFSARTIAGTVVTSRSSMTRGFVSMKYARATERHERVCSDASTAGTRCSGTAATTTDGSSRSLRSTKHPGARRTAGIRH